MTHPLIIAMEALAQQEQLGRVPAAASAREPAGPSRVRRWMVRLAAVRRPKPVTTPSRRVGHALLAPTGSGQAVAGPQGCAA